MSFGVHNAVPTLIWIMIHGLQLEILHVLFLEEDFSPF